MSRRIFCSLPRATNSRSTAVAVTRQDAVESVNSAAGKELRRAREAQGLARVQLVAVLPSGIGDRTLLSYELGHRQLTLARFVEVCTALRKDAPTLLAKALQRAHLHREGGILRVDLKALLSAEDARSRPLRRWALNRIGDVPNGIVDLAPSAVLELAAALNIHPGELATHLAEFVAEAPEA